MSCLLRHRKKRLAEKHLENKKETTCYKYKKLTGIKEQTVFFIYRNPFSVSPAGIRFLLTKPIGAALAVGIFAMTI